MESPLPTERNCWILCTYAEKIGNTVPNFYRVLSPSLEQSLYQLRRLFPYKEFAIFLENAEEDPDEANLIDFKIIRREDTAIIGDMEYWPEGYEPEENEDWQGDSDDDDQPPTTDGSEG